MDIQNVLPKDAIPSIDDPTFGSAYFGTPDDEVIVVDGVAPRAAERSSGERREPRDGDPPRAYPIRILSYHEIVNDELDGQPIAVTWCPICWSAVVYDRVVEGRTLTFGTSGKLADDALVMYDRETGSEWKQPTGEAIAGELEGARLPLRSSSMLSWRRFRSEYPHGVVLQPVRGSVDGSTGTDPAGEYDMAPYERYAAGDAYGLYGMRGSGEPRSWDRDDIDAKTVVLGIERGEAAVGYPVPQVEAAGGVVTDSVGELDLVVFTTGEGIYAFENPGFEFEPHEEGFRADGTTWDGTTGESTDGRQLSPVPARRLFAFAWQDAHGPGAFYGLSPK